MLLFSCELFEETCARVIRSKKVSKANRPLIVTMFLGADFLNIVFFCFLWVKTSENHRAERLFEYCK